MATLSSFGSSIKSIQRGTILITSPATSNTATITSVDTTKSELTILGGYQSGTSPSAGLPNAILTLTNSTTLTASIFAAQTPNNTIAYQVVEYY